MNDPLQALRELPPEHDALLCLDSDGCVFDSMGVKQRQVFQPALIRHLGLEPIADAVRETMEWTNMFSPTRGEDRFILFALVLRHLRERFPPERLPADVRLPDPRPLDDWLAGPGPFGNTTLAEHIQGQPAAADASGGLLRTVLAWTTEVDETVRELGPIAPFPAALDFLRGFEGADAMVVSSTPLTTLQDDWSHPELHGRVRFIASKDHGKKVGHLRAATSERPIPGHDLSRVILLGDAPKDRAAAQEVGVRFYPIIPGQENERWKRFAEIIYPAFLENSYTHEMQHAEEQRFLAALSSSPPWACSSSN